MSCIYQATASMWHVPKFLDHFLNEFYGMDGVLNRALSPPAAVNKEKQNEGKREVDPDIVVMACAYTQDDLNDARDYK